MVRVAIGAVLAWVTCEGGHALNGLEPRATTSWVTAVTIGFFRQHHLHRSLSFPGVRLACGASLRCEALSGVCIIAASAGLKHGIDAMAGFYRWLAWAVCLVRVAAPELALTKIHAPSRGPSGGRP